MEHLSFLLVLAFSSRSVCALTACPDNWMPYGGSCYYFSKELFDFNSAKEYCKQLSASLIHMNTVAENTYIKNIVNKFSSTSWWLGLSDELQEGSFVWTDDNSAPTFTDWYPGQPNGVLTNEDCTTLYKNYKFQWSDYNCSAQTSHPLCEKRGLGVSGSIIG